MKKKYRNIGISILVYTLLIIIWETNASEILPPPSKIFKTIVDIFPTITGDLSYTLLEAFGGFAVGVTLALITVVLMDLFSAVRTAVSPLIILSQAIPFNLIAPLLILILGYGILPKLVLVSLVSFFPLVMTVICAIDNIDKDLIGVAKLYGANKLQTLYYLKFPLSMPNFFAGAKIGAVYCMSSAVIAEWMLGDKGIGAYLLRAKRSYNNARVFAILVLVTLISVLIYFVIERIQKYIEKDLI